MTPERLEQVARRLDPIYGASPGDTEAADALREYARLARLLSRDVLVEPTTEPNEWRAVQFDARGLDAHGHADTPLASALTWLYHHNRLERRWNRHSNGRVYRAPRKDYP